MKMVFDSACTVFRLVFTEDQLSLIQPFTKEHQLYTHEGKYYFEFQRKEFANAMTILHSMEFGDDGSLDTVLKVLDRLERPRPFLKLV